MGEDTALQIAIAGLTAHLIERAKQSSSKYLTWLDPIKGDAAKWVSYAVSFFLAVGIQTTFVVDPATQLATLTLVGIPTTFPQVFTLGITWFQQHFFQKAYYLTAIKPHMAGVKTRGEGTGDPDGLSRDHQASGGDGAPAPARDV